MASFVVFKVKYGDTLRRFTAVVNEDRQLDLDIVGLRTIILSLFNFTASADLKLTYVDEDLDIVALVDEEDLQDVVSQGLNPVRITVQLNSRKGGSSSAKQTAKPTAIHPQGHYKAVVDLLKPVPEPLHETLAKLYIDAASKAADISPVIADLIIERIANAGLSLLNAHHNPQFDPSDVAARKETSECDNVPWTDKDASESGDGKMKLNGATQTSKWETIQCRLQSDCDMKKTKNNDDEYKGKFGGSFNTYPVAACKECGSSGKGTTASRVPEVKKGTFFHPLKETNMRNPNEGAYGDPPIPLPMSSPALRVRSLGPTDGLGIHRGVGCDVCGALPVYGPRFESTVKEDYDLCYNCFVQVGNAADYIRMNFPAPYFHTWSYNGNQVAINSAPWEHPLPPPRPLPFPYPGKRMKQYLPMLDSCFIEDVSVPDGTVMAAKTSFTKIWRMRNNGNVPWSHGTLLVWTGGDKFSCTDSVYIEVPVAGLHPKAEVDIAVDFIAPESPGQYISCWNLESLSGQKFGPCVWVLIQVDASLPDVACTASNNLNLNLPPEDAVENITQALNVEVGLSVSVGSEPYSMKSTKMEKSKADEKENNVENSTQMENLIIVNNLLCTPSPLASACSASAPPQPIMTASDPAPAQATCSSYFDPTTEADFDLTIEADLVDTEPVPKLCAITVPCPIIDAPLDSAEAIVSQVDVLRESEVVNNDVNEALLQEVEDMEFKQVNLNREILKKNNHNLEKSLYDLCGFCEWDLLLEEMKAVVY